MGSNTPNPPNSSHPASGNSGGVSNPDANAGDAAQGCGSNHCTITSETVQTGPGSRSRTSIGVGERVTLTVDPAPAQWAVNSGGTLSATSGNSVTFTAGSTAGRSTITATGSACSCSIEFTIVAPSGLSIARMDGRGFYHQRGKPSAGFMGRVHLLPDTVNFDALEYREADVNAVGRDGCSFMTGQGHHPGGWVHVSETVISGRGSRSGVDMVKVRMNPNPPYAAGTVTWSIPLSYRVRGGAAHSFGTIDQLVEMDASRGVKISKGGADVTFAVTEASSTMDESSITVETAD